MGERERKRAAGAEGVGVVEKRLDAKTAPSGQLVGDVLVDDVVSSGCGLEVNGVQGNVDGD